MTVTLTQSATAVAVNVTASFLALGGTGPYSYAVAAGGAGGTINASTGVYTAPSVSNSADPRKLYDTIVATDSLAATASAQILVGTPILLFCDIIQKEMGLADGRVYLWDQKILQPTDSGIYIAVSIPTLRPFSNNLKPVCDDEGDPLEAQQYSNWQARVDLDIISRGAAARDRKEELLMAIASIYSQQQQEANSFFIAPLSTGFINLSETDGAAIPYRYKISVNMLYAAFKTKDVDYFDDYEEPDITTNS